MRRQRELFDDPGTGEQWFSGGEKTNIITGLYSSPGVDLSALPPDAQRLFELSTDAFDAMVHAGMSELPITAEIMRFEQKILAAADAAASRNEPSMRSEFEAARRQAADMAATDRGDPDVRAVLAAAYKVWHEIHRLLGLLRFCPDKDGVYIARCEPDHFVLPGLGPHFKERFGQTSWAIIDEKRRLCLRCLSGGSTELFATGECSETLPDGEWGDLWRHYYKIINNESRNNPDLQRRFMPQRYWKYLTEIENK